MSTVARRVARLIPSKTAFLCCDIQERFRFHIHSYHSVMAIADKMIRAAKILDIRLVATEQSPNSLPFPSNPEPEKNTSLIALGSTIPLPLMDLPKHLHPDWSPLAKTKFSMMVPQVEKQLEEWETRSVVLFGIESHVCVLQTALDCLDKGIDVHVLADGVSSCNDDEVGIALKRMRDAGAMVTTSESALFQLIHDSTHPAFRSLVGLVKETKEPTKAALNDLIAGRGF
ncbi:uncharacterized protein JCM6883_003234 [Sporobolomyces salmoneus]|uniref:uncharacterized protein n=1 Tax=Sporobolomyces salmoneus TaxID=183962 RepID=UPI00316CB5AC